MGTVGSGGWHGGGGTKHGGGRHEGVGGIEVEESGTPHRSMGIDEVRQEYATVYGREIDHGHL